MELGKEITDLTYKIIGICMEVHRELGPGFHERYYQRALQLEFSHQHLAAKPQKYFSMKYKDVKIGKSFIDFEIDGRLLLEIKSVSELTNLHLFQVLKYLQLTNLNVALLVNFGKPKLEYKRILPPKKWQDFKEQRIN